MNEFDNIGYKTIYVLCLGRGYDCICGEYDTYEEAYSVAVDQAECYNGVYEIKDYTARADYKTTPASLYT